jgi:RHS repeat-associated protein
VALSGGYDARGNMTNDGRVMTYDLLNRLLTVTGGGANLTLTYDPEGRLASYTSSGVTKTFLYDGTDLIAEYDNAGAMQKRYLHGPGTDDPWAELTGSTVTTSNVKYLYPNYQGSIFAQADGSGAVTDIYAYGPYGEPIVKNASNPGSVTQSFSGSRFRYTGQTTIPEAGLYYYKARVYDPMYGRFLQADPVGSKDDLNLYAYVAGDPVNKVDPTGLAGCSQDLSGGKDGDCGKWLAAQRGAAMDVQLTQKALAAYRNAPDSDAGKSFATAFKSAIGPNALTGKRGEANLAKLERGLNFLSKFYADPGTAKGGQYDVTRGTMGENMEGTIRNHAVMFASSFFEGNGKGDDARRVNAALHEPLHFGAVGGGFRDPYYCPSMGSCFKVFGAYWVGVYANDKSNPNGGENNADSWSRLIGGAFGR